MPTYKLRTGITDPISEHETTITSTTVAVPTYSIMTEAILQFSDSAGYVVGETVTEATSGITGIVYQNDTDHDQVRVVKVSGAFTGGEIITGGTSLTASTPTSVLNLLNKTADTPVWTPLIATHAISATGVSDVKTVYLDRRTEYVQVWQNSTAVTVYNHSNAYELRTLPAGESVVFSVDGHIAQLQLIFAASGTCQVVESEMTLP